MPNRFIFSLRYANKLFLKFMMVALGMVFFMTLFRVNLYFLVVHFHLEQAKVLEILQSFFAGFRFDLLIFGYIFLPLTLLLFLQALLEWWPNLLLLFYKIYLALAWLLICAMSLIDFSFFAHHGERLHSEQYQNLNFDETLAALQSIPINYLVIFLVVTLLLLVLGLILLKEIKFGYWKDEYSPDRGTKLEIILRFVLPLILLGMLIGNNPDNQISNQKALNQMALNPMWCFDK